MYKGEGERLRANYINKTQCQQLNRWRYTKKNTVRAVIREGQLRYFSDHKKVTNKRTCERLRHRALLWWLVLWMLCNRRVREDGQIPCSATHTSQLKKYFDWKTVIFHKRIVVDSLKHRYYSIFWIGDTRNSWSRGFERAGYFYVYPDYSSYSPSVILYFL